MSRHPGAGGQRIGRVLLTLLLRGEWPSSPEPGAEERELQKETGTLNLLGTKLTLRTLLCFGYSCRWDSSTILTSVILLCLSALDVVSTLVCLMSRVGKWLRLQEELTSSHQQRSTQDAGGYALTGGRGVRSFLPSVLGMRAKAGVQHTERTRSHGPES